MIPRFGVPPDNGRSYRLRPGAYGLLMRDGRVLLTRQIASDDRQLPGGGIDPGEGQLQALRREVREETGWIIGGPMRIGAYRRFAWLPDYQFWAEKLCHVWLARPLYRRGAPIEPLHEAFWQPVERLPDAVDDLAAQAFLRAWLRR